MVSGVSPLSAIFTLLRGACRLTAQIRTNVGSVGEPGILPEILPLFSRREIPEIFHPLAHPPRLRKQVALMPLLFLMTVDSQFLMDNEIDLVQSQLILRDLDPAGSSVDEGSIWKTSKRAQKHKGSSDKRSNFVPSSAVNICFTNSQEFNSLVANSDELSITSKGNNENSAVHNISKDSSNEQSDEEIINSIKRSKEVINNRVKPVLSGHRIKETPSIKWTVAEVPKFISLICFQWNLY